MRLIDNPGVQLPTTCIVDRAVLVKLLVHAAADIRRDYLMQLAAEVESGERVSLTLKDWEGRE